jgi:hypothetical protein
MCYISKLSTTSHFMPLFLAHGDVVVGFAIFHIVYSKKEKKRKKEKKKGTPPWYMNVGGHPMESVSHGLRKKKMWGGVPSLIKSTKVPISVKNLLHFCMEDSKNPIASC